MGRPRGDLLVFGLLSLFLLQLRFLSGKAVDVAVGVVLRKESVIGRTGLTGLRMALDDFYAAHPNHTTRIRLHFRDYDGNIVAATSVVISLLKEEGAKAIIGPQGSGEAKFLAELANRTRVPMMSFSATSPCLTSRNTPYFIRTAVEDSAQAAPIAAIVENFKWRQVVLIYQDSEYGSAIVPSLIDALRKVNCKVHYRSVIPESPSDDFLQKELYKLKSMQTRVFVVHTLRETGMRLLSSAYDLGLMSTGYAWIVTDEITTILGVTRPTSALMKLEKYDGIVGDVTITNERAEYVDFTMPYTSSGVSMVVPKRDQTRTSAWIFLKPLTAKLWMVIFALFIGMGFIIWVLEHRNNKEFQGSFFQQLGTVLYFSFSTLVFAHRERIENPITKIVLVVWLFVVLTIQSSYTANLTTMLTIRQLKPTVTQISELIRTDQRVGYLRNSFMKQKLLEMKFKESNLVPLKSPKEYAKYLADGSSSSSRIRRLGVAAVIDETPYILHFLRDHCSNYTMTDQQLKTGGFGFAFPRGSPLVPDLSRAILNITEGDKMVEIERKWLLSPVTSCSAESSVSSKSLGFGSFWGLFAVTGAVTIGTLVYYYASYFYKKRRGYLQKDKIEERSQHGIGNESPESTFFGATGEGVNPPLPSNGTATPATPHLTPNSLSPSPPGTPVDPRGQKRFSDHGEGFSS